VPQEEGRFSGPALVEDQKSPSTSSRVCTPVCVAHVIRRWSAMKAARL